MADSITVDMSGLEQALRELRALPQAIQKRIIKGATATACSVIRKEAVLKAPEYTGEVAKGHPPPGTLKKAIYQARAVSRCTLTTETWVIDVRMGAAARTTKRGKGTVNLDAYYAWMVERGTSKMPAKPFMRPAFDAKKAAALGAFGDYVIENVSAATLGMSFIKVVA